MTLHLPMLTATLYTPDQAPSWDDFVSRSRNATFLHMRGYMDYHRDRFTDASLILRDDKGGVAALLPANIEGGRVISHGGLTYGGLLVSGKTDVMAVCQAFRAIRDFYHSMGIRELIYKPVPTIYDRQPAQEDRYALFLEGAVTDVVNISSAVDLSSLGNYNENTRRNIRKALREKVTVGESADMETFHHILSALLAARYSATPVHTLDELRRLKKLFPDNIRLLLAWRDGHAVAGSLLYVTATVVHTQYIASTDEGKACDALSLLFDTAIRAARADGKRYFDFGTSNGDRGRYLNTGLIRQKNGFGGRGVAYPSYKISLT